MNESADPTSSERFDIAKVVVLSGWSLTILVCMVVIGAALWLAIKSGEMATLKEWAGLCLGFLLGAFVTLVKDFIRPAA